MVCLHCGSKTQVINSRHQKRVNQVWRRRQCLNCKAIFTTEETAAHASEWQVRHTLKLVEPFSRDKLFISIYSSLQHRPTALHDASGLVLTIMQKLSQSITDGTINASSITKATQVALNRFDRAASTHYQAFHPAKI